jgi:hypothetical protein
MAIDTKSGTYGVFVLRGATTDSNIEYWKKEMRNKHESPNKFGVTKTVKFEEVNDEDGSRYINYWVE